MEERITVVQGEIGRLLICLAAKENWRKQTEASFRLHNDHSVISVRINLEDLIPALDNRGTSAFRGLLTEDYVVVSFSKDREDSVSLTLIQSGTRCLSSAFAADMLRKTVSKLIGKND